MISFTHQVQRYRAKFYRADFFRVFWRDNGAPGVTL